MSGDVRAAYPGLECGDAPAGDFATYAYCAGRLGPERWPWFGGDPVSSITFSSGGFRMSHGHRRLARFAGFAVAYLGLGAAWIYGVLDQGRLEGSDVGLWTVLGVVTAAHVAFGFGVREWPALLLPIAVLPLAILARYPESQFSEPGPVWLGQLVLIPFEILLIAAGLGLWALVDRRRDRVGHVLR